MQDFRVKTFLTVCRTLNYTRAAEELALTQPAVSQHITYLEQRVRREAVHLPSQKAGADAGGTCPARRASDHGPRRRAIARTHREVALAPQSSAHRRR